MAPLSERFQGDLPVLLAADVRPSGRHLWGRTHQGSWLAHFPSRSYLVGVKRGGEFVSKRCTISHYWMFVSVAGFYLCTYANQKTGIARNGTYSIDYSWLKLILSNLDVKSILLLVFNIYNIFIPSILFILFASYHNADNVSIHDVWTLLVKCCITECVWMPAICC